MKVEKNKSNYCHFSSEVERILTVAFEYSTTDCHQLHMEVFESFQIEVQNARL